MTAGVRGKGVWKPGRARETSNMVGAATVVMLMMVVGAPERVEVD